MWPQKPPISLTDLIQQVLTSKRVEPEKRWVGGSFGYAIHRFPIKDGISLSDVLAENVMKNNALFERLVGRK